MGIGAVRGQGEPCAGATKGLSSGGASCSSLAAVEAACRQNARGQGCRVSDTWRAVDRRENEDGPGRVVPACTARSVMRSGRVRPLLQAPESVVGEVAQGFRRVAGRGKIP